MIRDPSLVLNLYTEEKLSSIAIAKRVGISKPTILRFLRKAGVIRSLSDAQKLACGEGRNRSIEALRAFQKQGLQPKGEKSHKWKGGRRLLHGYVMLYAPDHPSRIGRQNMTSCGGYVFEHRLVMEKKLGRYLLPSEKVHHKNGIKDDNRIENLELVSPANHAIYTQLCSNCELRKEIRLLRWQIKELTKQLQGGLL